MAIEYETLVTGSLAGQIAEKIREAIMDGRLKADDQLPTEEELAESFKVSRPTIREALKRLAAQNLVRSRRGPTGGTFVNRPSHQEIGAALASSAMLLVSLGELGLAEIIEARLELETICCRFASERRNEANLAAMQAELEHQRNPELSDSDFCASDVRFHRALVDATQNAVLQFLMFAVIEALQPVANLVVFRYRNRHQVVNQHEQIYKAIHSRDADEAIKILTEQMTNLREQYEQAQEWRQRRDESQSLSGW